MLLDIWLTSYLFFVFFRQIVEKTFFRIQCERINYLMRFPDISETIFYFWRGKTSIFRGALLSFLCKADSHHTKTEGSGIDRCKKGPKGEKRRERFQNIAHTQNRIFYFGYIYILTSRSGMLCLQEMLVSLLSPAMHRHHIPKSRYMLPMPQPLQMAQNGVLCRSYKGNKTKKFNVC